MVTDTLLQNLRTLSTLQPNEKLCTTSPVFTVTSLTGVSGMWRRWCGEDRAGNVAQLQALFTLATMHCELIVFQARGGSLRRRLLEAMRQALSGITHLAHTYRDDVATVSSLTVLRENVEAFLEQHYSMTLAVT